MLCNHFIAILIVDNRIFLVYERFFERFEFIVLGGQTISFSINFAILKTCYNLLSQLCVQVKESNSYLNYIQHYVANISSISNVYDFQSYVIALAKGAFLAQT